jgi:hypothetical protein
VAIREVRSKLASHGAGRAQGLSDDTQNRLRLRTLKSVTVADVADKLPGIRNALVKVSCTVIRSFASGTATRATEEAVLNGWAHIAEWATSV